MPGIEGTYVVPSAAGQAVADGRSAFVLVVEGGGLEVKEVLVVMEELYSARAVVSKCLGSVAV